MQSVLSSMQVYWFACFVFPKRTLKELKRIFRRFLWGGTEMNKRTNPVAWKDVCVPYAEGGLAIRDLEVMNSAATLKLTWQVISHHPSLWVQWVHAHLVRGRDFWTIPEPQSASWCWRYILRSRAKARLFAFHIVGNGTNTRFRLDRWHPLGVLEDRFPDSLRYDSYLPREARVSNCIVQGAWRIPSHVIPHVRDIYEALDQVPIHSTHADKLVWSPSLDGEFSIKSTYHALREVKPKLAWTRLVWFKGRIPRHSFISWFALRRALKTRVKLFAWNIASSTTCLLCGVGEETEEHLFGSCSFGRQIWLQILAGLGYNRIPLDWNDEVDWCLAQFVGDW